MKKTYIKPNMDVIETKLQEILSGSTVAQVEEDPAGEDDFDAKGAGSFWDDED